MKEYNEFRNTLLDLEITISELRNVGDNEELNALHRAVSAYLVKHHELTEEYNGDELDKFAQ